MSSLGFHDKPAAVCALTALAAGLALLALLALVTACGAGASQPMTTPAAAPAPAPSGSGGAGRLPRPDHVVVVMMENHAYSSIIGDSSAAYLDSLAAQGASFTRSYAVTHPSEPNYLAPITDIFN